MRVLIKIFIVLFLIYACKTKDVDSIHNLDLRGMNLSEKRIDKKLSKYKQLEMLSLSENNLNRIPRGVFNLEHLKVLYLESNNIDTIPSQLIKLKHLKSLSISGNPIKYISDSISKILSLKNVMFIGNYSEEEREKFKKIFCTDVRLIFYIEAHNPNGLRKCNHDSSN